MSIEEIERQEYLRTLAAIRDPTEAEYAAAQKSVLTQGRYQGYSYAGGIYRAIIDAKIEQAN